jgi:single-strand DNA-binding protein
MNNYQIIGNLGQDARENIVSGKRVINFSVAVSDNYKDQQGNKVERTIWVDCSWWRDLSADYLKKGTKVFAQGQCRIKEYKDRNGNTQVMLSIQVNQLEVVNFVKDENAPQREFTTRENLTPQDSNQQIVDKLIQSNDIVIDTPENDLPF